MYFRLALPTTYILDSNNHIQQRLMLSWRILYADQLHAVSGIYL
jgi:hypothetical protein